VNGPTHKSSVQARWLPWLNLVILAVVLMAPLGALLGSAFSGLERKEPKSLPVLAGMQPLVLLGRSVGLAFCAAGFGSVLGLLAGYATAAFPRRAQPRWVIVTMLPLVIPPFVQALSWIMLADRFGGSLHGFWTAAWVLGLSFWPMAALLTWAGLNQSEGTLIEAARLGFSPLRAFWRVELSLIRPHLSAGFLLIFLFSFSDYGVPSLFRVNTYPVFVFSQFAAFYDLQSGVMASWPYVLLPMAAIWIGRRSLAPRLFEVLAHPSARTPGGQARRCWAAVYACILGLSLVLPLLILTRTAGSAATYVAAWKTAQGQLGASLLIAAVSATLMVALGFSLALGARSGQGRMPAWLDYASLLPVALPGTLFGMAMIFLWNRPQTQFIYGTTAVVVLLYVARFLPFATRAQMAGLAQIDHQLLDAARLADRPFGGTILRVLLPLLLPAMIVGWSLGFIFSLHELTGTLLVMPPGMETLSVRIYSLYHYGAGPMMAALSLFLVAASVSIFLVATILYRWISPCWSFRT
jgi:iron(III) transport system permease protein